MHLQQATLRKFVREALVTPTPLGLNDDGVKVLKAHLHAWFARVEELTLSWEDRLGGSWYGLHKTLCSVSLKEPHSGYSYGGFGLGLDAEGRLHLGYGYNQRPAPVASEEELFAFLRLCQARAVRMKGQQARQTKVRKLREAAIMARVHQLAAAFGFDYCASRGANTLKVALRFDGEHIVEIAVPFARFDEVLPQLERTMPQLRELVRAGIAVNVRPNHAVHLRQGKWVSHQPLQQSESADPA